MEMLIVAAIVVVAVGSFGTFLIGELVPESVLAEAAEHGRFAGLSKDSPCESEAADGVSRINGRGDYISAR
ncbi:hypothetical protein AWB67_06446 [Caballeronia terrestris]|jgi:hypothetical protein|uniref:Uncharacterized protein n=1 Tax=Caballeronia terrestris TaxID=1226301 RepID=A0A158KT19_9BURK|nr:hypothetical protein [Caballeronia terrestris]SAL83581.1 hypothetical protein AWB67_06446 [Caballeronia terrestris]